MKYLLSIIAFALGMVVGYFLLKPTQSQGNQTQSSKTDTSKTIRQLVFDQTTGKTPYFKENDKSPKEIKSDELDATTAEQYLANYKTLYPNSSISFSIDYIHVRELLEDPRVSGGLRVYLGVKDPAEPHLVTLMIVGVDRNRENVFFRTNKVIDYTNPCPKDCPPINGDVTRRDRRTINP